jgi:hypothetical protein
MAKKENSKEGSGKIYAYIYYACLAILTLFIIYVFVALLTGKLPLG